MQRNIKNSLENKIAERNKAMSFYCNTVVPAYMQFMRDIFNADEKGETVFKAGPAFSKKWQERKEQLLKNIENHAPNNVRLRVEVSWYETTGYLVYLRGDYTIIDQYYPSGGYGTDYHKFTPLGFYLKTIAEEMVNYKPPVFKALTVAQVTKVDVQLRKLKEQQSEIEKKIYDLKKIREQI